jgi:hypothetical protein
MITDKQRVANELQRSALCIKKQEGKYYLVYKNRNALLHDSTFENVRSILKEVEKNKWVLK